MGSAMTIGLALGGLNAASSILGSASQSAQMQAQANAAKAQAQNYEIQAKEAADKGRIEAQQIDEQKSKIRREYEAGQAKNRTLLASGNVDMGTGSAMDIAQGNAENFASDMGDNAYSHILKQWETGESVKRLNAAAANQRAQASAYSKQSNNLLPSILSAAIAGGSGFASGYSMAGGSLKNLWGGGDEVMDAAKAAKEHLPYFIAGKAVK